MTEPIVKYTTRRSANWQRDHSRHLRVEATVEQCLDGLVRLSFTDITGGGTYSHPDDPPRTSHIVVLVDDLLLAADIVSNWQENPR